MRSTVPAIRQAATELSRAERSHLQGERVAEEAPSSYGDLKVERRFVGVVREHLEDDVLIARIELSDGADRILRRRAASVITLAEQALATLPRA